MYNQDTSLSKSHISAAISKVEKVHNCSLDSISDYIEQNEDMVVEGFSNMVQMTSIDQKFSHMEEIFSGHPEFNFHAPFLVEVAALL